jgi:hypothetical protein
VSENALLRLLEAAHPNKSHADLLDLLATVPDRPEKRSQRPRDGQIELRGPYPPRKPQRPSVRALAIERRRRLASSGPLPPSIACRFTTGELAVLRIVGDEVAQHGTCDRTLGEIAARAGVCRALAQQAIRKAAREELLTVEERPQPGRKSLPNVVRIMSQEWRSWLERGPGRRGDKGTGYRNSDPTERSFRNPAKSRSTANGLKGFRPIQAAEQKAQNERPQWTRSRKTSSS